MIIQIGAATQAFCQGSGHAMIATPEAADIVAVMPVPFRPAFAGETTDQIGPAGIPCLCNEFDFAKNRIFGDLLKQGGG